MMRTHWALLMAGALVVGAAAVASSAHAQPSGANATKAKQLERAKAIEAKLRSSDLQRVAEGLRELAEEGKQAEAAVEAAEQLLRSGLPRDLLQLALPAVGAVGRASSSEVLRPYLSYRDTTVRRLAASAISRTGGQPAKDALRRALSDADGVVRGIAATGLGELGVREAVPDLFRALDHHVLEAAGSLGQLCTALQCEQLLDRTGKIEFRVLISGLDQILFRDPTDVSEELKLRVVGRVRELGTRDGHEFLKDVRARWPKDGSLRIKEALEQAVQATRNASADVARDAG